MLAFLISVLLHLSPEQSITAATWITGRPDLEEPLRKICWRESRCTARGVDPADAHLSGWGGQVRLGHLRPWCQPWKRRTWTTRGFMGLSAASNWEYLPPCYPPEILDISFVSAIVAALKYPDSCEQRCKRPRPWCLGDSRKWKPPRGCGSRT